MHIIDDTTRRRLCEDLGQASCLTLASLTRAVEDGLSPAQALDCLLTSIAILQKEAQVAVTKASTQHCNHLCQNNHENN
jgi:hypothetical protein